MAEIAWRFVVGTAVGRGLPLADEPVVSFGSA